MFTIISFPLVLWFNVSVQMKFAYKVLVTLWTLENFSNFIVNSVFMSLKWGFSCECTWTLGNNFDYYEPTYNENQRFERNCILQTWQLLSLFIIVRNWSKKQQFRIPDIISLFVLCVVSKTPKIVTLEKGRIFLNLATLFVPDATLLWCYQSSFLNKTSRWTVIASWKNGLEIKDFVMLSTIFQDSWMPKAWPTAD